MREIVLDTETTGFDAATGDRIVEIGCVELFNHIPTGKHYHQYCNPQRDMPESAFKVHGLSEEFLSDKPLFSEIVEDFLHFIGDAQLIIHNAAFDMGFLNFECEKVGKSQLKNPVIDTVELARKRHPGARVNLDALCKHYGIDNSRRTLHGALLDSEILAEVYLELIGGRQVGLALGSTEDREATQVHTPTDYPARPRPLTNPISSEVSQQHEAFIAELGDGAIWSKYQDN